LTFKRSPRVSYTESLNSETAEIMQHNRGGSQAGTCGEDKNVNCCRPILSFFLRKNSRFQL